MAGGRTYKRDSDGRFCSSAPQREKKAAVKHLEKKAVGAVKKKLDQSAYKGYASGRLSHASSSAQAASVTPRLQIKDTPPRGIYINIMDSDADSGDNSGGHGGGDPGHHSGGDPSHHGSGDDSSFEDSSDDDLDNNSQLTQSEEKWKS